MNSGVQKEIIVKELEKYYVDEKEQFKEIEFDTDSSSKGPKFMVHRSITTQLETFNIDTNYIKSLIDNPNEINNADIKQYLLFCVIYPFYLAKYGFFTECKKVLVGPSLTNKNTITYGYSQVNRPIIAIEVRNKQHGGEIDSPVHVLNVEKNITPSVVPTPEQERILAETELGTEGGEQTPEQEWNLAETELGTEGGEQTPEQERNLAETELETEGGEQTPEQERNLAETELGTELGTEGEQTPKQEINITEKELGTEGEEQTPKQEINITEKELETELETELGTEGGEIAPQQERRNETTVLQTEHNGPGEVQNDMSDEIKKLLLTLLKENDEKGKNLLLEALQNIAQKEDNTENRNDVQSLANNMKEMKIAMEEMKKKMSTINNNNSPFSKIDEEEMQSCPKNQDQPVIFKMFPLPSFEKLRKEKNFMKMIEAFLNTDNNTRMMILNGNITQKNKPVYDLLKIHFKEHPYLPTYELEFYHYLGIPEKKHIKNFLKVIQEKKIKKGGSVSILRKIIEQKKKEKRKSKKKIRFSVKQKTKKQSGFDKIIKRKHKLKPKRITNRVHNKSKNKWLKSRKYLK